MDVPDVVITGLTLFIVKIGVTERPATAGTRDELPLQVYRLTASSYGWLFRFN